MIIPYSGKRNADCTFLFEYVALHQTKELFGEDAGILYYGKIRKYQKIKRKDIKQLFGYKKNKGDEFCYFLGIIKWKTLDIKIIVDRMRRRYYTNIHMLKCCSSRPELSMTSTEQLRVYIELKCITNSMSIKDTDNILESIEYKGSYISVAGNYIKVKDDKEKKYLLIYASKCIQRLLSQIRKDIECE